MRLPWKSQRPRVRITHVRYRHGAPRRAYEIEPESYAGPWSLPEGTVLEVVYVPKDRTK